MIREMNHRVKNLFALISALVSICASEADSIDDFAAQLRARIHALGRSHSLTNDGAEVQRAKITDVVATVLEPALNGQTTRIDGPDIEVDSSQLTSLALILHEWATNSIKYGALHASDGELDVQIASEDDTIQLDWIETGGGDGLPNDPETSGFGTQLISATALQLDAEIEGEKTATGYRRKLVFPRALL